MSRLIFVSYRRADSEDFTLRLSDHLRSTVEADVFVDSQVIRGGRLNWEEQIGDALARCAALVVVVGPRWTTIETDGVRSLDREDDWVRTEIRTALKRRLPVYVVRIGDAPMPSRDSLPSDIEDLASKQAVALRPARLQTDLAQLLDWMTRDGVVSLRPQATSLWRRYVPVGVSVAIVGAAALAFVAWRSRNPGDIVIRSMLDEIDLRRSPFPPAADPEAVVARRFTVKLMPPPDGQWYVDISNTGGDGIDCLGPEAPQNFAPIDAQETPSTSARASFECRFTAAPAALRDAVERPFQYQVVYRNAFRTDQDRWLVKRFAYETRVYSVHLRFRDDRRLPPFTLMGPSDFQGDGTREKSSDRPG